MSTEEVTQVEDAERRRLRSGGTVSNPVIYETPRRRGSGIPVRRVGGRAGSVSGRGSYRGHVTRVQVSALAEELMSGELKEVGTNDEEDPNSTLVTEFLAKIDNEEKSPESGQEERKETSDAGDPDQLLSRQENTFLSNSGDSPDDQLTKVQRSATEYSTSRSADGRSCQSE